MSYLVDAAGENLQGSFSASQGSNVFTLACFVKIADWNGSTNAAFVFGEATTSWSYSHTLQGGDAVDKAAFQSRDTASANATYTGSTDEWDGLWVPMVGVTNGTSDRTIYIDAYANSGNDTTSRTNGSSEMDVVTLGDRPQIAISAPLFGLISHAALWTTVLSQTDIEAFMAATSQADIEAIAPASRVGYWPLNYDNSTQSNEGVGAGADLTVTGATFSTDDPFVIVDQRAFSPMVIRRPWTRKPPANTLIDRSSIQAQSLEVFYPVLSGSNGVLTDYSGNSRHGTKVGLPFSAPNPLVDGYMKDFGSHTDLWYFTADIPDLSVFTVSAWVIIRATSLDAGGQTIMSLSQPGTGDSRCTLVADNDPDEWGIWDNVNGWLRGGQVQELGSLVHVMMIYDGTTSRTVYYNNVALAEDLTVTAIPTGKTKLYIGQDDFDAEESWDGTAHDLRLYSKALSAAERHEVYSNPLQVFKPRLLPTFFEPANRKLVVF